ncbi:hypothetical protein [Plasmodium yoelii yoelii]|uniref:Uncharacterized protein n=1 Tax=Plasmodium yoelii yoelii TaxID=73239 RepID=Q7RN49_PLAYO|nr:hypothetical protein [Plasmodium yoelii yoelii]
MIKNCYNRRKGEKDKRRKVEKDKTNYVCVYEQGFVATFSFLFFTNMIIIIKNECLNYVEKRV